MLLMGGERDDFVPPTDVQLTGAYYGLRPVMLAACAHAIMLEAAWEEAAQTLCNWLVKTFEPDGWRR
jgi:hypothetical protein